MEDVLTLSESNTAWMEKEVMNGFRLWHLMFISTSIFLFVVVLMCCCFRFRIPRTKQEIEADYQRKKIVKKFRKRLQGINNTDMHDMDLKKVALEKVRAEYIKDKEEHINDNSSQDGDNDNSDWLTEDDEAKKTGTKKKTLRSQKNQSNDNLISTIYNENLDV